jgi:Holliday junction resolvase RusA-like endonuclease
MNTELSNAKHGDVLYTATIPLEPRSKKNSMEIKYKYGKTKMIPFISQSDLYKQYEKDSGWWLKRPKTGAINEKVNIVYHFYRSNKRRVDLSNLIAAADDILVKYNIIKDDNFIFVGGHDGSRVFIDADNPRTEIIIQRWE